MNASNLVRKCLKIDQPNDRPIIEKSVRMLKCNKTIIKILNYLLERNFDSHLNSNIQAKSVKKCQEQRKCKLFELKFK